jgi:hypothetical protein
MVKPTLPTPRPPLPAAAPIDPPTDPGLALELIARALARATWRRMHEAVARESERSQSARK